MSEDGLYQLKLNLYWKRKMLGLAANAAVTADAMDVLTLGSNLRQQLIPDMAILDDVEVRIRQDGHSELVNTYSKQAKVFDWLRMMSDGKGRGRRAWSETFALSRRKLKSNHCVGSWGCINDLTMTLLTSLGKTPNKMDKEDEEELTAKCHLGLHDATVRPHTVFAN